MKNHDLRALPAVLTLLLVAPDIRAQGTAEFIPLSDLPGGLVGSRGNAVSGSGRSAVGFGDSGMTQATFWASDGGGFLPPLELGRTAGSLGTAIAARAVSDDGGRVFGECPDGNGLRQAVVWSVISGLSTATPLGYPAGGGYSGTTSACSNDGLTACGDNFFSPPSGGGPPPLPITQAFRWTNGGGVQNIGTLPGVTPGPAHVTSARAMNADGSVIVGYAQDSSGVNHPWRWTSATGVVDISAGAWVGLARGVSPDGNTVVGSMTGSPGIQPFSWTLSGGRIDLGWLGGYDSGAALDASFDGARVCGVNLVTSVANSQHAVLWIRGEGWKSIRQLLIDAGVDMTGWNLQFANSMSDDGSVITGYGISPAGNTEAWVAVIPVPAPPCAADFNGVGGLTVQDIFDFLNAYFGNDPSADFNGSGAVTVQDIFDFLNAYFVGCP